MDITIRKIDEKKYRLLKAEAALSKRSIGDLINEAVSLLLSMPQFAKTGKSFQDLPAFDLGSAERELSSQVDEIVYGTK